MKHQISVGRATVGDQEKTLLGERMRKQRGASGIEMVVVIFVGLLILLAGMVWWPKLTGSQKNSSELENITTIQTNILTLKTASGFGPSGSNLIPSLITSDGIPTSMQKTSTTVFNSWGGAVTAVSTGMGYTNSVAAVPDSSCIFLATKVALTNAMTLKINGGSALSGEVDSITATSACNAGSNTLAWSGR
ncbi:MULTISPECIES: type 4 pilus major pilin [unclassified Pseudomonas]|uniref:type 4 pilus major pilin n=1 Tax=unclassified Pseudomonas TaxID=196821 RepID=UPI00131418DC|nr:type 4 pilus major pilin [Pseudomonas sp. MWU12-2020]